jgi:membrane fusion protein (multidrug efflux system)
MNNNDQKLKPSKQKSPLFFLGIILLLIAAGLASAWIILNPEISTDNAMVDRNKAVISSKTMGAISDIKVKEGDFVFQGEQLVLLGASELEAQRKQATANLSLAEESMKLASLDLEKLTKDFERAEKQYAQKVISTEEYEHSQKTYQSSLIDFEVSKKKIEVSQSQLELIEATLDNTRLTAPFDGVVVKKWMNKGDVLPASQAVLTLYENKPAWVTANFEETKISRIQPGNPVEIMIDAYPGKTFYGRVSEIGFSTGNQFSLIPANNAAGNFTKLTQRIPVKIFFNNSTDLKDPSQVKLLHGMSASVKIKTNLLDRQ